MSEWKRQSNRETVKTLLAMGFIPTWLEELLDYGDLIELQADIYTERALKAEEKLRLIQKHMMKVMDWSDWYAELSEILNSKQTKRGDDDCVFDSLFGAKCTEGRRKAFNNVCKNCGRNPNMIDQR